MPRRGQAATSRPLPLPCPAGAGQRSQMDWTAGLGVRGVVSKPFLQCRPAAPIHVCTSLYKSVCRYVPHRCRAECSKPAPCSPAPAWQQRRRGEQRGEQERGQAGRRGQRARTAAPVPACPAQAPATVALEEAGGSACPAIDQTVDQPLCRQLVGSCTQRHERGARRQKSWLGMRSRLRSVHPAPRQSPPLRCRPAC